MKYPRLPKEKYGKKILTDKQIEEIQIFYRKHLNIRLTARTFKVARTTVKYHTDPDWKKEHNTILAEKRHTRYHSNFKYREAFKKRVAVNQIKLRAKNPLIVKYAMAKHRENYMNNPHTRMLVAKQNKKQYKNRKFSQMKKYWANKTPQELLRAYIQHKESLEFMIKKEPLLILFN